MGIVVEPESKTALATGIRMALSSESTLIAANARAYSLKYLSIDSIMHQFSKLLFGASVTKGTDVGELDLRHDHTTKEEIPV